MTNGWGSRFASACALVASVAVVASAAGSDTGDKRLDRVKGIIGFQDGAGRFHAVFGKIVLPDDDFAVTQSNAAALVTLPDSSIVALGQNTRVRIGAFSNAADGPGSTITVDGGALRFDIRRPAGGQANYRFTTVTSQVAVRGTVELLSYVGGNTTVACLLCAADSVTVTAAGSTFSILSGQFLIVSAAGAVITGALTGSVLSAFSGSQVSTVASSGSSAATSGVVGTAGAPAAGGAGSSAAASTATTGTTSAAGSSAAGGATTGAASGAVGSAATGAVTGAVTSAVSSVAIGAATAAVATAAVTAVVNTAKPTPTPSPTPSPAATAALGLSRLVRPTPTPSARPTPPIATHTPAPGAAPAPGLPAARGGR